MSSLLQPNGDDHPDASSKHLADARALLAAGRFDGAAYLAGYVVECALKSLLQLGNSAVPRHHKLVELTGLVSQACLVAGATTAKYVTTRVRGIPAARIHKWHPELRYRSPSMSADDARAWIVDAETLYSDTLAAMILDGVIQ